MLRGLRLFVLLSLSLFCIVPYCFAQYEIESWTRGKTIIVPATQQWTNTNISLNNGDKVTITAKGCASTAGNGRPQLFAYWSGPEGVHHYTGSWYPLSGSIAFCLIGKIGSSGDAFYVGPQLEFQAQSSGNLYLGYNDSDFTENYGFFVAFVIAPSTLLKVANDPLHKPSSFSIDQNYPNPFNPDTKIDYSLTNQGQTTLKIFNELGQCIRTLVDEKKLPGEYQVIWDGTNDNGVALPSGQYFYQISQENMNITKKAIFLK